MDVWIVLVPALLVAAGFAWAIRSHQRAQRLRLAALDDLARARGWRLTRSREGQRQVTRLTDPATGGQVVLTQPSTSGSTNNRIARSGHTEVRAPRPALPRGRVVITQALPGGVERMQGAGGLTGMLQTAALRTVLARIVPVDVLENLSDLRAVDPPPGLPLTILASDPLPRALDLTAIHQAIQGWAPIHARAAGPPALTLSPDGMVLRLPECLAEAEDIAAFADHAQGLAARLG